MKWLGESAESSRLYLARYYHLQNLSVYIDDCISKNRDWWASSILRFEDNMILQVEDLKCMKPESQRSLYLPFYISSDEFVDTQVIVNTFLIK